jgi:hypothetical protein
MSIVIDSDGIKYESYGVEKRARWSDLQVVYIETTDEGPFLEDVFFVLVTPEGEWKIPQGDPSSDALLQHLQKLPGFDNEAVINAMTCMNNKRFLCWERPQ